ncbi:MAG: sulfite exporter TauE/SafE family protein [Chromatiales bacterium]|nr:sulfite exporter TauE/SafE family protein [Chromatiales bacterium]
MFGYTVPGVSATNLVYNPFVATPGGAWRHLREGRMLWPLVAIVTAGTLPGVAIGYWLRTGWLRDVEDFRLFVGLVLLYMAYRCAGASCAEPGRWRAANAAARGPGGS